MRARPFPDLGSSVFNRKLYEMIKEGRRVSEIREELSVAPSDLRAAVMVMKRLGIPVVRKGPSYSLGSINHKEVMLRSYTDLLTASIQATKVLRFIYGEGVKFLWPNKVVLNGKVIAELNGPSLKVGGEVDEWLEGAIKLRSYYALKNRRVSEVVRTANLILYKDPVMIKTANDTFKTNIERVNIEGEALTKVGKLRPDEVSEVVPHDELE